MTSANGGERGSHREERTAFDRTRRSQRGRAGALLAAAVCLSGLVAGSPARAAAVTATTLQGPVQGVLQDGVQRFLGIPFAQPPVGALRWRPPQTPASHGAPLLATQFGPHCPQTEIYSGFNTPSTSEDCLYLNVFAPQGADAGSKLPVMFWIFGGGFVGGEADDYDGSKLARQGHVIVVTINYRVGVFGTFALPSLAAEGPLHSNYAVLDQQRALQWTQRNIAGFGGDPGNITVFGESAGALSVYAHLISPLSKGMFQRAIAESGSFAGLFKPITEPQAEANFAKLAATLGCPNADATCLRAVPVETLLAKQGGYSYQPVVDGTIIPQAYDTAFRTGQFNRVPVINGTNLNELRWTVGQSYLAGMPTSAAQYQSYVQTTYGANAAGVLSRYPLAKYADPGEALAAVETDSGVSCASPILDGWLSRYVPTFGYEFHDPKAPSYLPPIAFPYGAEHTSEIQYLFPGYHGGEGIQRSLSLEQQVLSDEMIGYWTTFARTGQPSFLLAAYWPKYVPQYNDIQFLYSPLPLPSLGFSTEHNCAFWNQVQGWPANL